MPLVQSLDLLKRRVETPTFRSVLDDVHEKVRSGTALSDAFAASEFSVFRDAIAAGGEVRGFAIPGASKYSRRELDELVEQAKQLGASGLVWARRSDAGVQSSALKAAGEQAIGRALAALGYGTQFCQDHDFGTGDAARPVRIVDAPVEINASRRRAAGAAGDEPAAQAGNTQRATERQVKFIRAIAREAGLDEAELAAWSQELYSQDVDELNRRDASALIEALQRRRNEVA